MANIDVPNKYAGIDYMVAEKYYLSGNINLVVAQARFRNAKSINESGIANLDFNIPIYNAFLDSTSHISGFNADSNITYADNNPQLLIRDAYTINNLYLNNYNTINLRKLHAIQIHHLICQLFTFIISTCFMDHVLFQVIIIFQFF